MLLQVAAFENTVPGVTTWPRWLETARPDGSRTEFTWAPSAPFPAAVELLIEFAVSRKVSWSQRHLAGQHWILLGFGDALSHRKVLQKIA